MILMRFYVLRCRSTNKCLYVHPYLHLNPTYFYKKCTGQTNWINEIRNDWGHDILFSNGTGSARGTAMLFNPRLDYNIHNTMTDNNGRIICALIDIDEQYFNIVNLYATNHNTERLQFYTELEQYISTENDTIIAGDTNLALTDFDQMPGRPVARQTAKQALQNLMTKYELIDIWRQKKPNKKGVHMDRCRHSFKYSNQNKNRPNLNKPNS